MKVVKNEATMLKMLMVICGLLMLFSSGCGDGGNDVKRHLNEKDFAKDPTLVATPDDVVIIHLEPDTAGVDANDTYVPGIDRIPIRFPEDVSHTFVLEQEKETDAYFALLLDDKGNEILRLDKGAHEVTQDIASGEYTTELHHGGGIDHAYTLFIRPGSTIFGKNCPACILTGADLGGATWTDGSTVCPTGAIGKCL